MFEAITTGQEQKKRHASFRHRIYISRDVKSKKLSQLLFDNRHLVFEGIRLMAFEDQNIIQFFSILSACETPNMFGKTEAKLTKAVPYRPTRQQHITPVFNFRMGPFHNVLNFTEKLQIEDKKFYEC